MPDLFKTSWEEALAKLAEIGLVGRGRLQDPSMVAPFWVTAQLPAAGSVVARGTTVTFDVMGLPPKGAKDVPPPDHVTVPDLSGKRVADLKGLLLLAQLGSKGNTSVPGAIVWSQSPVAGARVPRWTVVTWEARVVLHVR